MPDINNDITLLRLRLAAIEAGGQTNPDALAAVQWEYRAAYFARQCEKARAACAAAIPLLEEQRVWLLPPDGDKSKLDADDHAVLGKINEVLAKLRAAMSAAKTPPMPDLSE